uniref:Histidine acid phosphatase n=1 Tax=Kodamaea ohmeri TaxID=34356 RepID=A7UM96_KODOH|nr:histidine acid phosphatase [Kodamaea ohmeri]
MVAISKLMNNGLLLASQSVFQDLATPEQAAVEQYNIINFLGGSAPYIQRNGAGISTDIPQQCTLEHVQLFSRHGERYPGLDLGGTLEDIYKKFKEYNGTFKGDLAFLNDYTYFADNKNLYEKETTPMNSEGLFSGTSDAMRHGAAFRAKYGSLYKENTTLPVFSSSSGRVFLTGEYFTRGFFGEEYSDETHKYVIVDEDPLMGGNSLTPSNGCTAFDWYASDKLLEAYDTSYLDDIADRFNNANKGLNISSTEVSHLFDWCAYELNVRGASPFCDIFTNEEFIRASYAQDLLYYYSNGPGNNDSALVGSPILEASLKLLKDTEAKNQLWLSFTHDFEIEFFHAALGLLSPKEHLPLGYIPVPNPYVHASIVPQGARIYIEKYGCGNDSYVRIIVNDAVVPIEKCFSGPGFSCKIADYEKIINDRLNQENYRQHCKIAMNTPDHISFYWNYMNTTYNAPLGNY